MQDDCGEEPEVTASSHRQAKAEMSAGSNRAVRENGCQMARPRITTETVRGRMSVEASPVCALEQSSRCVVDLLNRN